MDRNFLHISSGFPSAVLTRKEGENGGSMDTGGGTAFVLRMGVPENLAAQEEKARGMYGLSVQGNGPVPRRNGAPRRH